MSPNWILIKSTRKDKTKTTKISFGQRINQIIDDDDASESLRIVGMKRRCSFDCQIK